MGLTNYATCFAGGCLFTNGVVYNYATYCGEAGDGGRKQVKAAAEKAAAAKAKAATEGFSFTVPLKILMINCLFLKVCPRLPCRYVSPR